MRDKNVNMQLIYVNMQHYYVHMQFFYVAWSHIKVVNINKSHIDTRIACQHIDPCFILNI